MLNPFEDFDRRFVSQLRREVEEWQRDGTISAEQGQAILARYPGDSVGYETARRRQGLVIGLSILGAVLVGLGIITFFAANWDEIPRSVKLGALIAGVVLSYGAGFFLWQRLGYTAVGIALVLLGCIIYGAGVHLIGQIYHVPVDHPNLTAFWFLGVLPLAYVTRSKPVMFLAIVLFLVAAGFRLPSWLAEVYDADAVILASVMYLALATLIYAIGKAKSLFDGWEPIGGLFRAIGLIVGFGALYLLTFHDLIDEAGRIDGVDYRYWILTYAASVIAIAAMAGLEWWRVRRGAASVVEPFEIATVVLLLTASHVLVRVPVDWEPLYPIVINALFALAALGLMVSGYLQGREGPNQSGAGTDSPVRNLPVLRVLHDPVRPLAGVRGRGRHTAGRGLPAGAGPPQDAGCHARLGECGMKTWAGIAFWIVVAGQLVFLLGFIAVKEVALRTGTEVVLQTVPVDPRSLLQGDYTILDYEIATLHEHMQDRAVGERVYVVLKEESGVWYGARYGSSRRNHVEPGEVFIQGRVDRRGHADFGIGTYFVPEGTGHIIENAQDVKVVVNLDADGNAIIKEVLVDGEPFDPDATLP